MPVIERLKPIQTKSVKKKKNVTHIIKEPVDEKMCALCLIKKPLKQFYDSSNPIHKDKKFPYCKECIIGRCYDAERDEILLVEFQKILQEFDRPFCEDVWLKLLSNYAKREKRSPQGAWYTKKIYIFGEYFKKLLLKKYKDMTWQDGINYNKGIKVVYTDSVNEDSKVLNQETINNHETNSIQSSGESEEHVFETIGMKSRSYLENKHYLPTSDFEVTADILHLYGEGYTSQEYEVMNRIYNNIKEDYPNISNNQKQLLIRYVRFAAKEEIATSYGVLAEAEKWAKLSSDALKQLNSSDIQGGITSFAEFFQKIEREKDIIPILPRFKYRPNDAPDFIIWCFINYCRRLEGKSQCSYEDVYRFYDEKKNEYIKETGDPYGVFKDDPSEQNRDKIEHFIELPPDFYMNDDSPETVGSDSNDL